jgi:hypothetical protein
MVSSWLGAKPADQDHSVVNGPPGIGGPSARSRHNGGPLWTRLPRAAAAAGLSMSPQETSMLPRWRLFRRIVTITFVIIVAGLVLLAYAIVGRFPGVTLAFFGIVLPIGFFLIFTVVGWQRSAATGIPPNAVVGWLIRNNIAPFLPVLFLLFLLGIGSGMDLNAIDRSTAGNANAFQQACIASTGQAMRKNGRDPDSAEMKAKAVSYCGCIMTGIQHDFEPAEFIRLASDPDRLDKDAKMNRIVEHCAAAP